MEIPVGIIADMCASLPDGVDDSTAFGLVGWDIGQVGCDIGQVGCDIGDLFDKV